jgi:hypothetical protein
VASEGIFFMPPGFEPCLVSPSTGELTITLQECWHEPQIYACKVQIKIAYQAYCMPTTELMYYNAGYMLNAGKQS